MRKFFAIFLVVCLIWGIGVTALATEHMAQAGSKEIEVTAKSSAHLLCIVLILIGAI